MEEYRQIINRICENIHNEIVDFEEDREKIRRPTMVSSEFITNKQQGDWAEDVLFRAINDHSSDVIAVRYGKSDNLVAGDEGFEAFFSKYQEELDTIGKRPDLLLFKAEDYDSALGTDISNKDYHEIDAYVRKAIAGIEVRSSAFFFDGYMQDANRKVEENRRRAMAVKEKILNEYRDLLETKSPKILSQIEGCPIESLDYRVPGYKASQHLKELNALLSELMGCVRALRDKNSLSFTPKDEDLKVVYKWIMTYNVPHYYVQVFFDRMFGVSFCHILELIANSDLKGEKYFIEKDPKNQNKTTIKIPVQDGVCLVAEPMIEPRHYSMRKELGKGRLLFYVGFDGGEARIDKEAFDRLFGCNL